MRTCKFPGMTRTQYDENMTDLLSLCYPNFRRVPGLTPEGLPDIAALMALAASKRRGLTAFGLPELGGMYRPVERPKTGLREAARRRRQQGVL